MPSLNWTNFNALSGSRSQNFENLCRALMRVHFERFGQFKALRNQPGVEFHLELSEECPNLGAPPRWYGWQCKFHERTTQGHLRASSKKNIEKSLHITEQYLPNLTDWVLWTPYTLSRARSGDGLPDYRQSLLYISGTKKKLTLTSVALD